VVKQRQWSTAFTPRGREAKINISQVPATLKQKFAAKCRREGRSQRNLILNWVKNWVAGRRPDDDGSGVPTGMYIATTPPDET